MSSIVPSAPKLPIYLDFQASTPADPRVVAAMMPYFSENFGNPASKSHEQGWISDSAVERAREQVADLLNATPDEVIFTSGATESNNLALFGVMDAYAEVGKHLIVSAIEHKSVLDPARELERRGFEVTVLEVDQYGLVHPEDFRKAIRPDTVLASIIFGNNEIGTVQPIAELASIARSNGVCFHTDAVQAIGMIPIDVQSLGVDLLSLSGHKIYGPKGVGALYLRRGSSSSPRPKVKPQILGGGHEFGLRSGSLNVPGIVGLGQACSQVLSEAPQYAPRIETLRNRLWKGLRTQLPDITLNGHPVKRLPQNLNLNIPYVESASLMMAMREVAFSSAAACDSFRVEPSHVLTAIGVDEDLRSTAVRFSLGRSTTTAEVDYVIEKTAEKARELRLLSPLYIPEGETVGNA